MDVSDLPVPLSRIEKLWNCLITGETPDFKPLSRNEKYLMAMLDRYDISNLPAPMSRGEKLLYKIAIGETDLSDVPGYLSRYEELLKYLIENGEISGGDFEYVLYTLNQSLSTLYTTAEKPVKSAILKGQTLVNYANGHVIGMYLLSGALGKYSYSIATTPKNLTYKKYTIIQPSKKANRIAFTIPNIKEQKINAITNGVFLLDLTNETEDLANQDLKLSVFDTNGSASMSINEDMFMIVEGDYTNVDIPYFEGMQSVKMPVLTTTGKNLFDEKATGLYDETIGKMVITNSQPVGITKIQTIRLEKGTYTLSLNNVLANSTRPVEFRFNDFMSSKLIVNSGVNYATFTVTESNQYDFIIFAHGSGTINRIEVNIQLEKNSINTLYEPYKTNILTVNEPIELRGIGDVQDTLDCLTGELAERIGDVVLDGSEDWTLGTNEADNTIRFKTVLQVNIPVVKEMVTIISDNFPVLKNSDIDVESVQLWGNSKEFNVRILKTKASTVDEFKSYLSQNPITIQYELATESVKTVDLSVVDQDNQPTQLGTFENVTHVSLEAENLIPEVEMEVATNLLEDTVFTLTDAFNTLYPTAEKPVKSAILKGNTVKNEWNGEFYNASYALGDSGLLYPYSKGGNRRSAKIPCVPNIKYTIRLFGASDRMRVAYSSQDFNENDSIILEKELYINDTEPNKTFTLTTPTDAKNLLIYYNMNEDPTNLRLLVYRGEDKNYDYFEGMQSVKMPVLTTTGKNLFDKNQNNLNKGIMPSTWSDMGIDFIFKSGTYYAKDDIGNVKYDEYLIDGSINRNLGENSVITVTDNTLKIRIKLYRTKSDETFEEHYETFRIGTSFEDIVSYEPYKTNILTVNEPIELRGIGDVQDTLDLITGELTQRIGEVVFNGSENWITDINGAGVKRYFLQGVGSDLSDTTSNSSSLLCDKFKASANMWTEANDGVQIIKSNGIYFIDSSVDSLDAFVNKLKATNIKVQYSLIEKPIKTVDLSVVDQDGNVTTLKTFDDTTHVLLHSEAGPNPGAALTVRTKIPSGSSTSLLMDDISTEQQQLETTVDEQSNNVDATMIAATEIYEETL